MIEVGFGETSPPGHVAACHKEDAVSDAVEGRTYSLMCAGLPGRTCGASVLDCRCEKKEKLTTAINSYSIVDIATREKRSTSEAL